MAMIDVGRAVAMDPIHSQKRRLYMLSVGLQQSDG